MLFNSLEFAVFFAVVFPLYLFSSHKLQNLILLVASYFFYGWWDWRFLGLIFISTFIDYFAALKIDETAEKEKKKIFLWVSMGANLGILGFFKYFNFFAESFRNLMLAFGWHINPFVLHIVLPVGVSFYTFQAMSYTIDVYRGNLKPARNFFDFALFVSYFPQLVAGPIERATHLLPQVLSPRILTRDKFYEGCYLIFWGLFQKIFIADNLAPIVEFVFAAQGPYHGAMVLIGTYAFAFQILCDFEGYSNMARGLGKCMGFDIMINFNLPYFSTNPSEFWRRWHISLSEWLRDYLYIPLGGNRHGVFNTYRNLVVVMILGGLWHGASWHFVVWGAYHGLLLIAHRLLKPVLEKISFQEDSFAAWAWLVARIVVFFHLICLGWIFFRASNLTQAWQMIGAIFSFGAIPDGFSAIVAAFIYFVFFIFGIQTFQYSKNNLSAVLQCGPKTKIILALSAIYLFLYTEIMVNSVNLGGPREFIYFQF